MLKEKVITECYFWAWVTLNPEHLLNILVRILVMGALILAPLIAMNQQLADRGIQAQPPSRSISPGAPERLL